MKERLANTSKKVVQLMSEETVQGKRQEHGAFNLLILKLCIQAFFRRLAARIVGHVLLRLQK